MLKSKRIDFEVFEDNGGGLTLFIKVDGELSWGHAGYQFGGDMLEDVKAAIDDPDYVKLFENNGVDYGQVFDLWEEVGGIEEAYRAISENDVLLADKGEVYWSRMGAAALVAFEDVEGWAELYE